jgi:hypothetical protein
MLLACSQEREQAPVPVPSEPRPPEEDAGHFTTPPTTTPPTSSVKPSAPARKKHLQWKRAETFEADLAAALELPRDQLCKEFGTVQCIRDVHLVPLGGYDVFSSGMLEGAADPIVTTPAAIERVLLSACSRRVRLDLDGAQRSALFGALDLHGSAPPAASPELHEFVSTLYRRMLGRDASEDEVATLASLSDASACDEFAKLACFTVGSLSEFIFF